MGVSLTEAIASLLGGKALGWKKYKEQKAGSISLASAGERRLLKFLLEQDSAKVAQASEDLFGGLIEAWENKKYDPANDNKEVEVSSASSAWRLERIEASGFGGLTLHGGAPFDLWVEGNNWCLEGQNGSGKTSLASSILWALTGRRIREQEGPIDDRGVRAPVLNPEGKEIGKWPPLVSYPPSISDLAKPAEVWVRLTFKNDSGEIATAYRRITSPPSGDATVEEQIDPRLRSLPQLIETGILMPARLARIGFGDRSQSLYEAVKLLTGLDQLADIADGCAIFTHGGRRFLKYAKDQGADTHQTKFSDNLAKAEEKATELQIELPDPRVLGQPKLGETLKVAATEASTSAGEHLATLKSEIATTIDTNKPEGRAAIKKAVATARHLVDEKTKGVPLFQAWRSLGDAIADDKFKKLGAALDVAEAQIVTALVWHERQKVDSKLRLKALAAQSYIPLDSGDAECPLCESKLDTAKKKALAAELDELKENAEAAERKIEDVCRAVETEIAAYVPQSLKNYRITLNAAAPREAYSAAMLNRFSDEPPFKDILLGVGLFTSEAVKTQVTTLPAFDFAKFYPDAAELKSVTDLRQEIHALRRLIALAEWWTEHRQSFVDAWVAIIGKMQEDGSYTLDSIEGKLEILEQALAKAQPLDDLSKYLIVAADAADKWAEIQKGQLVREAIAKALEPLKELRALVNTETASSIGNLSGKIKEILGRIHLRERLSYEEAVLGKKIVNVTGSFDTGIQIDAALVANSSWLRAILWAFLLALREQTLEGHEINPFPLLVLDDPQVTFDPRNKRQWAKEIVTIANAVKTNPVGAQLIVTTHERQFYQCLIDHEKFDAQQGLIGGVNKISGVATIANGGCLQRLWKEAETANDDAKAREYMRGVRIYCEDLLKFMLRSEGPAVSSMTLNELKIELKRLQDNHVAPFDRKAFSNLIGSLNESIKAVKLINDTHHKDDESYGMAQASEVKAYWEKTLLDKIHAAFGVYDSYESFSGEPRTFPWATNVIPFPTGSRDHVKALQMQQTGIAAAAKTDGRAGDGILTVDEWDAGTPVVLPNHEVYQLAAGTLDPVAGIGDLLIVSNYAKINARNLVVATHGSALLARRYNRTEDHPEIIVLTGQNVDPTALPEPIIAPPDTASFRKVVGTLFAAHLLPIPPKDAEKEIVPLGDVAVLQQMLNGSRLFQVKGRSAEPIALEGQFLITRDAVAGPEQVQKLNGRLIVAVDETGARYFKRLRCHGKVVVLESLNPDGTTAAEVLSFDGSLSLPKLTHALEVVGVLFELPDAKAT